MNYKGILFDLDGTLLDTSGLIIHTFEYAFEKVLNRKISRAEILRYWGVPLADAMQELSPEHWEELLSVYREYNVTKHDELVMPFPDVNQTLHQLTQAGIKCAVVSSKLATVVKQGLRLYNMDEYFVEVIGAEHCTQHKPHPEPVLRGLAALNMGAQECIMVGDTEFDILSAQAAGVRSVAVSWSLLYPQPLLERVKPDYIIHNMSEILEIVKE